MKCFGTLTQADRKILIAMIEKRYNILSEKLKETPLRALLKNAYWEGFWGRINNAPVKNVSIEEL